LSGNNQLLPLLLPTLLPLLLLLPTHAADAVANAAVAAAVAGVGFQRVYNHSQVDPKCRLCQLLVEHRKAPRVHHVLRKQHLAGSQQEGSGGCNCNFAIHMIALRAELLVLVTAAAAATTTKSATVSDRCHQQPDTEPHQQREQVLLTAANYCWWWCYHSQY